MARQGTMAPYDPVAAQVGPSLMPSEDDATATRDLNAGWKAMAQAGADAAAKRRTASAAPVAPRTRL